MKKKILYISAKDINRGGVQFLIKSWIDNFSNFDDYDIFWYCLGDVENDEFYKEITNKGVSVICGKLDTNSKNRYIKFYKQINELINKEKFDIVHINTGLLVELYIATKAAKANNVKRLISHSHNVNVKVESNIVKKYKTYLRKRIVNNSDYLLACSDMAAISAFGDDVINSDKYSVLKNGIDLSKYNVKHVQNKDEIVFCNIGGLGDQKNQLFLIDVFNNIHNKKSNTKLYIAGKGELKEKLDERINKLNIKDSVILLGEIDNPVELLRKSDAMIFPSKYEGLGIVAIEAQAVGIKTYVSNKVPNDVDITDLVKRISLEYSAEEWASIILKDITQGYDIKNRIKEVRKSGYDISLVTERLEKIYNK